MASEHGDSDDDQSEQEPQSTIILANPAYTLNNSDNPGTLIVSSTLNDNNYRTWLRTMKTALRAKVKLGFVDGSIKKPARNSAYFSSWEKAYFMVMAWIINAIDPNLHGSIPHTSTAREIWIGLEERFSQINAPHIHQLWCTICLMQKDSDMSII